MDNLGALLSEQLSLLTQLGELLDNEKLLLEQRDVDSLAAAVKAKQALLNAVAAIDEKMQSHPERELLATEAYKNIVSQLKSLLLNNKKKSQINEEIVQQSLSSMERLSKILSEVRNTNSTYDATAKKVSLGGSTLKNIQA